VREVYELDFKKSLHPSDELFSAASLTYLMEQCQSLKALKLENQPLDEDRFRVLGEFSRPGLEIELKNCRITGDTAVLAAVLESNKGPTKLDRCYMDSSVFATGLRGNSRLKSLRHVINRRGHDDGQQEVLEIAGALKENKGLVELVFIDDFEGMSDETWYAVCDSLKTHPTLEVLHLGVNNMLRGALVAPSVITSRAQALVDMLKVNTSIHTIPSIEHSSNHKLEHELIRRSVIPYLERNRLRPRLLAIQKAWPVSYRAKVLGRALLATRTDVNSLWMLISGNAGVALSSTTATTTPAPSTTGAWSFCCCR
jgi:hypothetical protein